LFGCFFVCCAVESVVSWVSSCRRGNPMGEGRAVHRCLAGLAPAGAVPPAPPPAAHTGGRDRPAAHPDRLRLAPGTRALVRSAHNARRNASARERAQACNGARRCDAARTQAAPTHGRLAPTASDPIGIVSHTTRCRARHRSARAQRASRDFA
jgi:hypothetical protein